MQRSLRNSSIASAVSFISTFNTFSLLPLVALYGDLYGEKGAVSVILSVSAFVGIRALVIAILTLPAGFIVDKLGLRIPLIASIPAKIAGTTILLFWSSENATIFAALLLGLGTAIGKPALKAYIANLGAPNEIARLFSMQALSINLGIALAPFATQLAISIGSEISMVGFLATLEGVATVTLAFTRAAANKGIIKRAQLHFRSLCDYNFAVLLTHQFLIGFCMALSLTALLTGQLRGDSDIIQNAGLLISLQSIALVVLQFVASIHPPRDRWFPSALLMIVVSTGCIIFGNLPVLVTGLLLLAGAEVVLMPLLNSRVAIAVTELRGTAYSVLAMAEALGDSAAALYVSQIDPQGANLPIHAILLVMCLATIPATFLLRVQKNRRDRGQALNLPSSEGGS